MKRNSIKLVALVLALSMCLSMSSCTSMFSLNHKPSKGGNGSDYWDRFKETVAVEPTDSTTKEPVEDVTPTPMASIDTGDYKNKVDDRVIDKTKLDKLTYPDHIASSNEIHPDKPNGTVSGQDAIDLVYEVESDIMKYGITDYVDISILFENPEKYGLSVDKATWGDISYDTEKDKKFYDEELQKLYSIDKTSLSGDDLICYNKMRSDCELNYYASSYSAFMFYEASLNALTGPQCEVLFILDVIKFKTVEDAQRYIELLVDIDRYYDDLCYFEELRAAYGYGNSSNIYEQVAKSFDSLVNQKDNCFLYGSFEKRLEDIKGLSASEKDRLINEHQKAMQGVVFPEFQECADRMRKLKDCGGSDKGMSEFEGGDAYYSLIFEQLTNSTKPVAESNQDLIDVIDSVMNTYSSILYDKDKSWISDFSGHDYTKGDTKQNLDYLEGAVKADFPELHEHSYDLMDVPKELEENFSPAAFLGYHLDNYFSNMIITNNSSVREDFGVTCAHEGYPGHMFQSVYTRSKTNHPYMYIFDSTGYAEGWATYAENYSMKYYAKPSMSQTMIKINNELNVLLMARCDIGIHCEGWTADNCADYFSDVLGVPYQAKDLQDMYDLLVLDPGYAIKYGIGFINTGLVIEAAHNKFPDKSDKEIHTAYLNALPATFEQIQTTMFEELEK